MVSRKLYRPKQCSDFGTATFLISDSTDRSISSTSSTRQIPFGYIYERISWRSRDGAPGREARGPIVRCATCAAYPDARATGERLREYLVKNALSGAQIHRAAPVTDPSFSGCAHPFAAESRRTAPVKPEQSRVRNPGEVFYNRRYRQNLMVASSVRWSQATFAVRRR